MTQINAGRVRYVSRGEYNNSTQYYLFDLVNYNGSSYYAKENTLGNLPTDTSKWQLIAEKGSIGQQGPQGATGNGIANIQKTSSSGLIDTYTITYTDGTTTTYEVTNGEDGEVTQSQLDEVIAENDYLNSIIDQIVPKTTATGTTITLEDTLQAKMNMELNPSELEQETTTGKNLLNPNLNLRLVCNVSVGSSGTLSNYQNSYTTYIEMQNNATYVFSGDLNSVNSKVVRVFVTNDEVSAGTTVTRVANMSNGGKYTNSNNYKYLVLEFLDIASYTDGWQLEVGSTATSYEPYTGGIPSPNPQYPQEIHTISGDNTIKVVGKNLFDDNTLNNTWINSNGTISTTATGANCIIFNCKENDTFTLSATFNQASASGIILIAFYDSNNTLLNRYALANNTSLSMTYTAPANTSYMYAGHYLDKPTTIQLEKSSSATTYTPYQEQLAQLNLGAENLWKNQLSGFLPQSGSYPTTNTTYPDARYVLVHLLKGQSITLSGSTSNNGRVRYIDTTTNQVVGSVVTQGTTDNEYYISTANFSSSVQEGTITAKKDLIIGIMDLGTQINNLIVNYGTIPQTISDTPLEYSKIGNYADVFMKPSGTNLFNANLFETFTTAVQYITLTLKPNTAYTLSSNIPTLTSDGSANLFILDTNSTPVTNTNGVKPNVPRTITTLSDGIVRIGYRNLANELTEPATKYWYMLNEGSSALPYEPYDTTKWYLKKNIGKIDVNNVDISYNSTYNYYALSVSNAGGNAKTYTPTISSHFANSGTNTPRIVGSNGYALWLWDTDNYFENAEAIKQFMINNNVVTDYVLATPQYTPLNDTLQNQLNTIESMLLSYKGQTNISQINNDLPFIITSTALKEL